ncbi:hypothetical protein NM208_g17113 [Fusarium decemcellulare]|uniref:Uncharacterized protein n=1 Tax=Fusarium decemcellulare TaxID=57161 RepID=A0ACC1R8D7_9HYPO|nr:hypothetical protein NM208_g17113 [Fusarium decemcellulare]
MLLKSIATIIALCAMGVSSGPCKPSTTTGVETTTLSTATTTESLVETTVTATGMTTADETTASLSETTASALETTTSSSDSSTSEFTTTTLISATTTSAAPATTTSCDGPEKGFQGYCAGNNADCNVSNDYSGVDSAEACRELAIQASRKLYSYNPTQFDCYIFDGETLEEIGWFYQPTSLLYFYQLCRTS